MRETRVEITLGDLTIEEMDSVAAKHISETIEGLHEDLWLECGEIREDNVDCSAVLISDSRKGVFVGLGCAGMQGCLLASSSSKCQTIDKDMKLEARSFL